MNGPVGEKKYQKHVLIISAVHHTGISRNGSELRNENSSNLLPVSTDNQEAEGTSLQTQLEAALKYCQEKSYDVRYRFCEAYSGHTLERPKLNELRELIRAGEIDVIVVYCLERCLVTPPTVLFSHRSLKSMASSWKQSPGTSTIRNWAS